jgi:hypothetical protein
LKPNESVKALVWKQFSLVFQKQLSSDEGETLIVMSINFVRATSASRYTVIKEQMELSSFRTKSPGLY